MRITPPGVVGALLLGMMLQAPGAVAEGAVAFGSTGDYLRDGFAIGFANNWRTSERAKAEALTQCQNQSSIAPRAAAKCQIVASYKRECVAVAFDPKEGKGGVGWALGPDQATAEARAMAACQANADPGRAPFCKLDKSFCDTNDLGE